MKSKVYKCLVVDDEPIARKIVISYVEQSENLELFAECKNAIEAIEILNNPNKIDIVFLDINMPTLNGISMVKVLDNPKEIIFTTAYSEFAVDSYNLNAVDYLLKPFSFERFSKSIEKATYRLEVAVPSIFPPIQIRADGKIYFIDIQDILFCESMRNYTRIFLKDSRKLMTLISLSKFEIELNRNASNFIKVHRSYVVSKNYIDAFQSNFIFIQNHKIPIGIQYKSNFLNDIQV